MSLVNPGSREIALGLTQAVRPVLGPGAPPVQRLAARDVAQLLGLKGLDAALAELDRFAGALWPDRIAHMAARIARVTAEAEAQGSVTAFYAADSELAAHAAHVAAQDWSAASDPATPAQVTLALADQLADVALEKRAALALERVSLAVAASLRAALDWLGADELAPIEAQVQDTALTLTCAVAHPGGIAPAAAILASVEGSLLPESGRWAIRVPLHAERASYLLVRQGHLSIALPWHSVARLRMFSQAERAQLVEPQLASFVPGIAFPGERPAALVALGLKRAWCVVDRIVWRIAAEAEQSDAGPFAPANTSVRLEGGERFWVLPPAWSLRDVLPVEAPAPEARSRASRASALPVAPEPAAALAPAAAFESLLSLQSEPIAADTLAAMRAEVDRALGRLEAPMTVLDAGHVEPQDLPAQAPEPESAPSPGIATLSAWETVELLAFEDEADTTAPAALPTAPLAPPPAAGTPNDFAPPKAQVMPSDPTPSRMISARLEVLRPESVQALGTPPPSFTPPRPAPTRPVPPPVSAATTPIPSAPPVATPAPARGRGSEPLRALVVDDSLVARVFLTRLLERRGYQVEQAANAAECWSLLPEQRWSALFIDVALPDARGGEHVADVVRYASNAGSPPVIVLTRDAAEATEAIAAGAHSNLHKPFDAETIDLLLHTLPAMPTTENPR